MNEFDVIVVGAGASGLMAALDLALAGKSVQVLEARSRIGGRIHTVPDAQGTGIIELGAEFIHGDLPVTQQLLQEAGLSYHRAGGEMWRYQNGCLTEDELFIPEWEQLAYQLKQLQEDMPLTDFLSGYFPGDEYELLRKAVIDYAAGYDTADPTIASSFALRDEWLQEEEAPQYRIDKGYGALINYMAQRITALGSQIVTDAVVKEVHWQPQRVMVTTREGDCYKATYAVIALPLGVLKALPSEQAAVSFVPAVTACEQAFQLIGMGAVIKVILEFTDAFWNDPAVAGGNNLREMQFLFSDQRVGTWWTQLPDNRAILTGWLGGYKAVETNYTSKDELIEAALTSLAGIFDIAVSSLEEQLLSSRVTDWTVEPFTSGSYSYATVQTHEAVNSMAEGVANTLLWAGEAFYTGPLIGTVEAALISGKQSAARLLQW